MANKKSNEHHVVPDPDGGWNIIRSGSEKVIQHFDTKNEAVDRGRVISSNQGTEFVIHKKDGTIQQKDSHGNDPCPPKDQK